jgi:ADP-ribose pyrophosphatase
MKLSRLNENLVRSEEVYSGALLKIYRDIVETPDGHHEAREVLRHPGASVVVPHLSDNRFVMVRQFRYALDQETLEFPAGRLDPGENPENCARRELAEETGYQADCVTFLFKIHPAPGYTDEIIYVYLAENLTPGPSCPDPDEYLLTTTISLDDLMQRFKKGEITDSKTLNAIFYLSLFKGS